MKENININYDLDYSKDKTIDKRILEVCALAEAKYLENLKKSNTKKISDINDLIINNNNDTYKIMFSNNDTKSALETNRSYVQNKSYFSASKIGKIANKSISLEKNLLSQKFYNNKQSNNFKSNFIDYKNRLNTQRIDMNKNRINNNKLYLSKNPKVIENKQSLGNISKTQRNFNFKRKIINQKLDYSVNSNNKLIFEKDLKLNNILQTSSSAQGQYKPLFSKNFKNKYIFPHIQHIKNKNKFELNKILLKTQNFLKHKKYLQAFNLLKETISAGEYHSDLFYLFGEVNRILRNYQNAEYYLLLSLNFEIHSPNVFYSMGMLYHELKQYSYSNIFLKLFIRLIDNDKAHFLRTKNYVMMEKYLKAAKEITKAIELNEECEAYYKYRSEIYNKLGLTEIANQDLNMYNFIKNKKIEENK